MNGSTRKGRIPTSAQRISRAASSSDRRPSQTRFGAVRHQVKSGSSLHSSSCQAPTSSSTSSGIRSATARTSAQSVRQPRWPSETATTAPGSGAGNESAARPTSCASRPASRSSSASLPETTNVSDECRAASSCRIGQPAPHRRRRVVGDLVAVPAPVPQLGRRPRAQQRLRERPLDGMEDRDGAQVAAQRAQQAPRRDLGDAVAQRAGQACDRPVRQAGRTGGDDASARSRSRAWSARMNPSSGRGSSRRARGSGTCGQ